MANPLFRTKSIESLLAQGQSGELKRSLNALNLTFLGVGAIIGAGIFAMVGTASQAAGPAIILSFVLAAVGCAFAGLCYAEFAAMIPVAGSAYVYSYATMGEFVAFVIGWALTLEYALGASTVAVGWSGYVVSFLNDLGVILPGALTNAIGTDVVLLPKEIALALARRSGWTEFSPALVTEITTAGFDPTTLERTKALFNLPAMLIIAFLTMVLSRGISESAKLNNIIVIVKTLVILVFIFAGIWYVQSELYEPFIPSNPNEWGTFNPAKPEEGGFGHLGWTGILAGAGTIFFAYIGFDAVSTAAQETKNPARDLPIGILASLFICTAIYILVAYVLVGLVPFTRLNVPDPIAVGIDAVKDLAWLRFPIKLGAIMGLTSVMLVMMLGQSRVFYSMGKDGLLPSAFGKIHPKYQTPMLPTIITGVAAALLSGLLPIGTLGHMVSFGTLLAFAIVSLGILILRRTRPDLPRPFRTPWVPFVPIMGVLVSIGLIIGLEGQAKFWATAWILVGLAVYFLYSRHNSVLQKEAKARGE